MATISLCMIVKNEEEVLHRCLSSVSQLCEEMIIVDTGSSDRTKEIAHEFTEQIYDFDWIDDFSAARNFAFNQATMEYILWIDADDVLLEKDQQLFKKFKDSITSDMDYASFIYNIAFDEFGNPTFSYRRNRLVKRERNFKWHGVVHEYLSVYGKGETVDIAVTHRKIDKKNTPSTSNRNLDIYEKRLKKGEAFSPRDLYYYANELKDHRQYRKATIYYHEFLATNKGWVEDQIRACLNLANCYKFLNQRDKQIESLVLSLKFDVPRPQISCQIGDMYLQKKQHKKAIIWYRLALEVEVEPNQGFTEPSYHTWYPHLQLCVCYWAIGKKDESVKHNNAAKEFRPNDTKVLFNEKFFNDYFKKNESER